MNSNAQNKLYPVDVVFPMLKRYFGKTYPDYYDGLELIADCVHNEIGNIETTNLILENVKAVNKKIKLPEHVFSIESVTFANATHQGWFGETRSEIVQFGHIPIGSKIPGVEYPFITPDNQDFLPYREAGQPFVPRGVYVPFEFDGDCIKLADNLQVDIIAKVLVCDDDGFPMMTERAAKACASYINKIMVRIDYLANRTDAQRLQISCNIFDNDCSDAKMNMFTDNQLDAIMNVMKSWSRKRYGLPARVPKF